MATTLGRRSVPLTISYCTYTKYRACFLGHPVLGSHVSQPRRMARDGAVQPEQPVQVDEDRDFIIHGLGLPFELLYFEARAQLRYATDELMHIRRRDAITSYEEFQRSGW
jgi:hypothetical protein